jgi:ElaB/YqjD/DUF883 family membrane-anchored ribosome-binding protein
MAHTDIGARNAPNLPGDVGAGERRVGEQATQVADTATEGAKDVVHTAMDQAAEVGTEIKEQGRDVVNQARSQLRGHADDQTQQIAGKLRELGDEMRALVDGRPEQAQNVRDYADQAAGKLSDLARRLESRGFDGVVDDVKSFARRRPGAFLAGAAVAGMAVGRLLRNSSGSDAGADTTAWAPTPPPVATTPTTQHTGLVAGPAVYRSGVTTELPTGAV